MAVRFVDARGTEWEVWEVGVRPTPADVPPRPRRRDRGAPEAPCLHFESATQRRCLTRYPARWHAMGPSELAALCEAARPMPPDARRRPGPGTPGPPIAWG
jgi:hypothetical protein